MDVDKWAFYGRLLDILTDISESHFVAFDLELSGVPSRQGKARKEPGQQTLQERYLETKEAAERFQILQIGMTCVRQDTVNGRYILKPYNFDLSPLIEERGLDVEREFTFQSGAIDFLQKIGFDIGRPFQLGVPYLARQEARDARHRLASRQDRTAIADIAIKPTDVESLAFLDRVRNEVEKWKSRPPEQTSTHINIGGQPGSFTDDDDVDPVELSRFEKRLVHQVIRAEFPDLVTISRRGIVQIVRFDKKREARVAKERKRELDARLARQKGFRWIIEALQGSDISNLDLKECAKDPETGYSISADMYEYRARFSRAQNLLLGNPRMLVGHNCFLDLVYLFRTFIGPLPPTVGEFQTELHKLWPRIVDTKYMSTHNCGDINPVSSLEQIAQQLSSQQLPRVEVHPAHSKYEEAELLHEAGYDSYLTAQIAVRLSSKLRRETASKENHSVMKNGRESTSPKKGTKSSNAGAASRASQPLVKHLSTHPTGTDNLGESGIETFPTTVEAANHLLGSLSLEEESGSPTKTNAIDQGGFTPAVDGVNWKRHGEPTLSAPDPNDLFKYDPSDRKHRHRSAELDKTIEDGMPKLDSGFWEVYGNKLRVFGTEEGVCVLGQAHLSPVESDAEGDEGGVDLERGMKQQE